MAHQDRPIDVSQDLSGETDDRDRGYGIEVNDDGDIVQRNPEEDEPPDE